MTIQLPALAVRASFIATVAAVLAAAMVFTGRAEAAGGPATPVLAQGAGWARSPVLRSVGCSGRCSVVATTSARRASTVASGR